MHTIGSVGDINPDIPQFVAGSGGYDKRLRRNRHRRGADDDFDCFIAISAGPVHVENGFARVVEGSIGAVIGVVGNAALTERTG